MDTEQQIRLNFLDEAEEYLDRLESSFVGLADAPIEAENADLALRSAHSIKGGAAMMGFNILSNVAHRLEDFLKVLRVRHVANRVETEVEALLLQSVDRLRDISKFHRQGAEVDESDISTLVQPIFAQLSQRLGELEVADENALLSQDEDVDPAVLIFEEGVDGVLNNFENQLSALGIQELAQELSDTAQELIGFGMMASLNPFVQLCESVQQQVGNLDSDRIQPLAEQALKSWRRSHALVLRGNTEKLPSCLEGYESTDPSLNASETTKLEHPEFLPENFDPLAVDSFDLSDLQSEFELNPAVEAEADFDPLTVDSPELGELSSAFELDTYTVEQGLELLSLAETPAKVQPELSSSNALANKKSSSISKVEKMVRVPVSQLKQFNTLFEQLVLNRNSINLRLTQLQNVVGLMGQRMSQMEQSNTQLKQWYDRASVEGLLSEKDQLVSASSQASSKPHKLESSASLRFDDLEMDRYSDIHLICQEQIETIVQLQEVAKDIEFGVREVNQSVRDLHYTTKSMQGNVTRTQMLPFAEAVKRFPRTVRELNLQFNKRVELKIIGETTLLDRSVIEALSDPLMHLLRNSFDHGIEDNQTRTAAGKSESGTITIQASNQGTYSAIAISDDGGGINLDKIRDRVCEMGMTQAEVEQIPESELLNFIFEPGFSTAQQVTQLSGRGVGMDIVRTNLREVRGDVEVSTEPGKGTTFILRIPFSLSILRVAIVEQKEIIFAIPANNIKELITHTLEPIAKSDRTTNVRWNQSEIPLIEIEKILIYNRTRNAQSLTGEPNINHDMTLIVGDKKSSAALKISRFWNEQESTIRTIESPVELPPGVVSSVVFGDGKVIPLIDPTTLVARRTEYLDNSERNNNNIIETNEVQTTKTILVVDDSINVRRYLSFNLEKAGYRVEQAKDGREAVDKLTGGLSVDAVICDLEMPRLDGYGVLEEIKERPEFANLPISMLTSRSNEKHRKLAMNLGASAYFSKPYNEQELLDTIHKLLHPTLSA